MKRIILVSMLAAVAVSVHAAPSRSAFIRPSMIQGVTFSPTVDGVKIDIGGMPRVAWGRNNHKIVDVFGVYGISDKDSFGSTGKDQNGWKAESNFNGRGGVSGWAIKPPQDGLQKNESLTFRWDNVKGAPTSYGIHARLDNGCTYFFEQPCAPVPEPATMATLGLGAIAMIRRRRAARKS